MKPGPKPSATSKRARVAAGAAKPDLPQFDRGQSPPIMPEFLAEDPTMEPARLVWGENLERVTANGCHEGDSDLFARYCIQESGYRAHVRAWLSGAEGIESPPAAMIESLRKMGELLGIAGPSSRQRLQVRPRARENTFSRNGTPPK